MSGDSDLQADNDWLAQSLACPDCTKPSLKAGDTGYSCQCGFFAGSARPVDLRPKAPVQRQVSITPGSRVRQLLEDLPLERPVVTDRVQPPARDSSELFAAIAAEARPGARFLDLGCGPRDQEPFARARGLKYCGVDFASSAADFLADAHALPFADSSFDIVFSFAVLEHLYSPTLALREIHRILAPGGVYVGTVSQGEPFHDSYYHHTSWGLLQGLELAGLRPERIWPASDTLRALSVMGRYPKVARLFLGILDRVLTAVPMLSPRKHFKWTARQKALDTIHRTSAICFVARRT